MGYVYIATGLLTVLVTAFIFLLIYRILPRIADKRMENFQKDLLAAHYEEVQNIYKTMRGWRHDYKNHIQTMKAHLAMDQLDELGEYLAMLDADLQAVDTLIKTGNVRLDAILNSKLSLMASKNIRVNAKAQVPESLTVNEVDLCIIIGNLLNNAMESCEKLPDEKERFIRIYIGLLKQQLYLSVSNSTGGEIKKLGPGRYGSLKGEGHGFGLRRIDSLVKKYGGYINRQNEPGVFATEIMLPL